MFYTRRDVVAVPVEGLGPNHVCLAWAAARRSALIRDFADLAGSLVPPDATRA